MDKSPLAAQVAAMRGVDHCLGSGFALEPQVAGRVDWLFSDMACYPERLFHLVQHWLNADAAENFVCTIKLQGKTDHEVVQAFRDLKGSEVIHLSCNKAELTGLILKKIDRSKRDLV
jgi:23S rRNA (cytidine2498-2'-O)-methyltransferase